MDSKIRIDISFPPTDEWSDYYLLRHDFDTSVWGYRPRPLFSDTDGLDNTKGYPEMVPFVVRKGMYWTDEIVRYMFDLCCLSKFGFLYKSEGWSYLSALEKRKIASEFEAAFNSGKFATNGTGIDKNYNPIGEEVLGEAHRTGLARQWEVACGGNIVKAVSNTPVKMLAQSPTPDAPKEIVDCLQVEVWDGKNPAPNAMSFNWNTHPHLVHWATISTPFVADYGWRVDPFSFFNGHGTPYTLLFNSPNYVPMHRVRRLKKSEVLFPNRPYYP